jgi:hypothetical protein
MTLAAASFSLLLIGCAGGFNVSGEWSGTMTQPGNLQTRNGFSLVLKLSQEGTVVTGISRIEIPETEYFGVMRLEGTLKNDSLYFKEVELLDQKPRTRWCLKEGTLKFDRKTQRLAGPWNAEGCSPGEIDLLKVK